MAIESPLKKDILLAAKEIEALQRVYNIYFQGGEEDPPHPQRKNLDNLINKIKTQIASATNSGDRFLGNSMISKYQLFAAKWDRMLRGVEDGTIVIPKKRK